MRGYTVVFLCLSCLLLFYCHPGDHNDFPDYSANIKYGDRRPGNKTWTIMVYMAADNNLDPYALPDLDEMEKVCLEKEGVQVLALCDRNDYYSRDWHGTRLYRIKTDGNPEVLASERLQANLNESGLYPEFNLSNNGDLDELNMGDPDTLAAFITWCRIHYPADCFGLVLWNHGAGWRPRNGLASAGSYVPAYAAVGSSSLQTTLPIQPAICQDETPSDILTLKEVKAAISASTAANPSGEPLALIGTDACLMGLIETAYELTGQAQYLVASQLEEPGEGWDYTQILWNFIRQTANTPECLGHCIVDAYRDSTAIKTSFPYLTMACINLDMMQADFNDSFAEFSAALSGSLNTGSAAAILTARSQAQGIFAGNDYNLHCVDFYGFISRLAGIPGTTDLMTLMQNPRFLYFMEKNASALHGLSIYFPCAGQWDAFAFADYINKDNQYISFTAGSAWDDFLTAFYAHLNANPYWYNIKVTPASTPYSLPEMNLYAANLKALCGSNADGTTPCSFIDAPLVKNMVYYLKVRNHYGPSGSFQIRLSPVDGQSVTNLFSRVYTSTMDFNEAAAFPDLPGSIPLDPGTDYSFTLAAGQEIRFTFTLLP